MVDVSSTLTCLTTLIVIRLNYPFNTFYENKGGLLLTILKGVKYCLR